MTKQTGDLVALGTIASEHRAKLAIGALQAAAALVGERRPCKLCAADVLVFRGGDHWLVFSAETGTEHQNHCPGYRIAGVYQAEPVYVEPGSIHGQAIGLHGPAELPPMRDTKARAA